MGRIYPYSIFTLLLLMILTISTSTAQVRIQVVSQSFSRIVPYAPGMSLVITGENAEIYCTGDDAEEITIELSITSRNEDKSLAEADLKKMKWLAEVKGETCYARNYIELGRNESKPSSSLKAVYHINVPAQCPVEIRNYFGRIEADSLDARLKINSEFTPVRLSKISGTIEVSSTFGDMTATDLTGKTTISSNRSIIDISGSGGEFRINATGGEIRFHGMRGIGSLFLTADESALSFKESNLSRYTYKLDLTGCNLRVSEKLDSGGTPAQAGKYRTVYTLRPGTPILEFILNNSTLTIEE